jgi:replicative DNA helicase
VVEVVSTAVEDAGCSLIGCILQQPEIFADVVTRVKPEMIRGSTTRRHIYEAMQSLYRGGKRIGQDGIRWAFEKADHDTKPLSVVFVNCLNAAPDRKNAHGPYVDILVEAYQVAKFHEDAGHVRGSGDVTRAAQRALERAAGTQNTQTTPAEVVPKLLEMQDRIEAGAPLTGYGWGLDTLDDCMRIQSGRLYCVAGLKAGGKTLFLLNTLDHNLADDVPCFFVSLEATSTQAIKRMVTHRAGVNSRLFPNRNLNDRREKIERAAKEVAGFPLVIEESAQLTVDEIAARIRAWKYRDGITGGIVGVDFLQLVQHERGRGITEATALGDTAYTLARTAKDLDLAIVATVQLRNEAEGQRPHMRLIEGSGRIAQAAEGVLLLDLVARRDTATVRQEAGQAKKQFNIHIGKNRDGEGDIQVRCMADLSTGHFYERTH